MASKEIKLSCRNVWKVYGKTPDNFFDNNNGNVSDPLKLAQEMNHKEHIVANANVSFDVHVGEIFVIMGLSGSGKSTIIRCLSRLVEPTAGEVILDNEDLLKKTPKELTEIRRHKMGMVFQSFGLIPHLNVIENIAFPLKIQNFNKETCFEKAKKVIQSCQFEKMKKMELEKGFSESVKKKLENKKIDFFHLGPKNNYKKLLTKDLILEMNKIFKDELKEFKYE